MRTSPEGFRLLRIERWREVRYDRLRDRVKNDDDRAKAMRAADLYTEVALCLDGLAMGSVATYSDHSA